MCVTLIEPLRLNLMPCQTTVYAMAVHLDTRPNTVAEICLPIICIVTFVSTRRATLQYPPLGSLAEGFEESYTVSGCSIPEHCGVFQRVAAHCIASSGSCPGGRYANGNTDPTLCDGAPVYQRQGDHGGGAAAILYRFFNGDDTVWYVGSSNALAYCSGANYLESASAPAANPTAPAYSAGAGWYDDDASARGTIAITAGDGQH
jgi:hypothetical protein